MQPDPRSIQTHSEATAFVVHDVPGFQVEFYPPSTSNLTFASCKVYGYPTTALVICIEQLDEGLVAGIMTAL